MFSVILSVFYVILSIFYVILSASEESVSSFHSLFQILHFVQDDRLGLFIRSFTPFRMTIRGRSG